jgi:hypothetical protein
VLPRRHTLIALLAIASAASAQGPVDRDSISVSPGLRIRFRIADTLGSPADGMGGLEIRGNLVSLTRDSLTVSVMGTAGTLAVARSDVMWLAVSRGRRSRIGSALNALRPAGPMLAINGLILSVVPTGNARTRPRAATFALALPVLMVAPRSVAALFSPTERWENVSPYTVFGLADRAPGGR